MPPTKKKPRKGIWLPSATKDSDVGIAVIRFLDYTKYQIKYQQDGKWRFVPLPQGTTLEEARERRNHLYRNLRAQHGAKTLPKRNTKPRKPRRVHTYYNTYIYARDPWIVRIGGKQIGSAKTKTEALTLRNDWLRANPDKVPRIIGDLLPAPKPTEP